MAFRKTLFASCLLVATLLIPPAGAQTAQPRRPDVVFVPTTDVAVGAMLKLAEVKETDVVYDLGCGDGRIVIAAARLGARAVGIDIDPVRIAEAKENARKAGPEVEKRVQFIEGDLFTADIHEASVVTLFLLSTLNAKLRPKLLQDLKPGTRIVSNTFGMRDWKPEREVTVGAPPEQGEFYLSRKIMLWTIPSRN